MNNQPAFPCNNVIDNKGMTLRDYFAGRALQGLLTSDDIDASYATAVLCYRMADAMMKAREG